MKLALATLAVLALVACSNDTASPVPTAPSPPPAKDGVIWAMAVEPGGSCIVGATFEVVSGNGPIGKVVVQETPCSVWDGGGVQFPQLTPGIAMTLRASAPGYTTVEKSVLPNIYSYSGGAEIFVLRR